ncbi:hypothetical protein ACIGW0_26240 [Streptomyces bikiniensis]|uniref:Uncharacterized protein n=1 Tax=Streptomyces bikiniensis TaxID=1896 RepID=A0ABW8CZB9_STRBI
MSALHHGLVGEGSSAPVEVCAPTGAAVDPSDGIGVRVEPARHEVFVPPARPERGDPVTLPAHDALASRLEVRGLRPRGPAREAYCPDWATAGPGEHVVDAARPFLPAG